MKRFLILFFIGAFAFVGCSNPDTIGVLDVPSTDDGTTTPAPPPPTRLLYVEVGTKWESEEEEADADTAEYTTKLNCNTPAASPLASTPCKVTVPEGQLYYSDLRFRVGTEFPELCPIISFRPYFYQRSEAAAYIPAGSEDGMGVDCSGATTPPVAECYGGAAPVIMEGKDFPESTGLYFLSNLVKFNDYTLPSSNSQRRQLGLVNYMVTNDLAPGARATSVQEANDNPTAPNHRVGGTFNDYVISCQNYWGETLYNLVLTVADENIENGETGAPDDYLDWN